MQFTFDFLKDLCVNNNKEWFNENRDRYQEAKKEVEGLSVSLIEGLSAFDATVKDLEAKKCIFRIFRDVRFAKDKTPYKNNFGMHFVPGGKKCCRAGYYLHLEPDNSFIAGGIYLPTSPELRQVREAIYQSPDDFLSIVNDPVFKDAFGEIDGDKLKTTPKGFPKDFEHIDLLRFKSYIVMERISDDDVVSPSLIDQTITSFKKMQPLNTFINTSIK